MPRAKENRFPILCLSALPLECVAKHLMCRDIFQFSTISRDCFDAMKDAIRSNQKSRGISIDLWQNKLQLTLYADSFYDNEKEVEWHFNGTWNRRRRWNVDLYSGPQPKTLVFREKSRGRYVTASNSVEELLQLAEHIANLFRAHTKRIAISAENCRFLPAIQHVPVFQQTREVNAGHGIVSHDTMVRLLTGFQARSLCILCNVEPNFQFNGQILTEELSICKSFWFTAPLFYAFNGRRLVLNKCVLTNVDVNTYLRNWKASHSRWRLNLTLEKDWNRGNGYGPNIDPESQRRWDEEKFDIAKITEGLEDIRHVPAYHITSLYSMFKRPTDGMVLSLQLNNVHHARSVFVMCYYSSN